MSVQDVSRRKFLALFGAATAATAIPGAVTAATEAIPAIFGDGVHDDTLGLKALIEGRPVNVLADIVAKNENGHIVINGGKFLVSDEIEFHAPRDGHLTLTNTQFTYDNKNSPPDRLYGWVGIGHIEVPKEAGGGGMTLFPRERPECLMSLDAPIADNAVEQDYGWLDKFAASFQLASNAPPAPAT